LAVPLLSDLLLEKVRHLRLRFPAKDKFSVFFSAQCTSHYPNVTIDIRIMSTILDSLLQKAGQRVTDYRPLFFRAGNPEELQNLEALLRDCPQLVVYDEIYGQLRELIKLKTPQIRLNDTELAQKIKAHLKGCALSEYGVWVFYPWSFRLVHILDESEFIDVRTNRNQHKITQAERDLLGKQKVGVIGLSVGKTIAVAMAMERSFGEIRLADFDLLELSNLNRIQTGTHNLGIFKAVAVAREIAEIDPFLQTICYNQGLTEENMDDFFLSGGKLDILVEECDGLDIKILCRLKAKALGIPVVMDMNDRGTLDIERFDLEPDRPLLHGLIDHLDISRIKDLSNEEKIPFILPMLGEETISSKLKASMLEVGQSISTWPQLASSVVLGGAIAADACRRIALNQFHDSGRYFVDMEELVCDKLNSLPPKKQQHILPALTESEMMRQVQALNLPSWSHSNTADTSTIQALVTAACLAPSEGNSQPWKWLYTRKTLYLFLDAGRTGLAPGDTTSQVALGAATENLLLKARSMNLEVASCFYPFSFDKPIAHFHIYKEEPSARKNDDYLKNLADQIPFRSTSRKVAKRSDINERVIQALSEAALSIKGVQLTFLTSLPEIQSMGELIAKTDRLRLLYPEEHAHYMGQFRWSAQEFAHSRDGIDIHSLELSPSELAELKLARNPEVIQHLITWKGGQAFEKPSLRRIASVSAFGLLTMTESNSFFEGGRAMERMWLTATSHQVGLQPITSPLRMFSRLNSEAERCMLPHLKNELNLLHSQYVKLFSPASPATDVCLFRLCEFEKVTLPLKTLRLNIEHVLHLI
jgi:hypothetical protein